MSVQRKIRRLTHRERSVVLSTGLMISSAMMYWLPFFDEPISRIIEEGLLPAAIAYTLGMIAAGCSFFWAVTYLLRCAAASPGASRRFVRLMEPTE